MSSFDTQVQIEETIQLCSFCEEPLAGATRNGLHVECDEAFAEELDVDLFEEIDYEEPEEEEPNEGHIEYALQSYYGFGSGR